MIKLFNNVMGTIDSCPYIPRGKCIEPVTTAALISGGASLLGNILGFGSSQSANQTNMEIAKMNNEHQYKMFQEQMAYNTDMWNKQNEYNLPSNVVKRLLDAGINPAAVFGSGSATPASQLTAPQLPSLQQAHVSPFQPDFSGVGNAVNAYFQNELISKDIESKGLDNQAKNIELQFKVSRLLLDMQEQIGRIDKQLSETNLNKSQRDYLESQRDDLVTRLNFFKDNIQLYSDREKLTNDVMKAQQGNLIADTTLKRAQASYQNMLVYYYPQITQAQLNVMSGQFADLVQSAQLKAKQGELTSAQAISQYLRNGIEGMEFENKSLKHKIKYGSGKVPQTFWYSLDMISDAIFGNLKLLGK